MPLKIRSLSVSSLGHQSEFSPQNRKMTLELLSLPSRTITRFPPIETGRPAKWLPIKIPNSLGCSSKTRNIGRFLCLSAHDTSFGGTSARVGDGDGVIIVDHGSRRKESNLMLNEFVEMFKHKTGYEIVEPAHMELAEPSIADAFECCIKQGYSFLNRRSSKGSPRCVVYYNSTPWTSSVTCGCCR